MWCHEIPELNAIEPLKAPCVSYTWVTPGTRVHPHTNQRRPDVPPARRKRAREWPRGPTRAPSLGSARSAARVRPARWTAEESRPLRGQVARPRCARARREHPDPHQHRRAPVDRRTPVAGVWDRRGAHGPARRAAFWVLGRARRLLDGAASVVRAGQRPRRRALAPRVRDSRHRRPRSPSALSRDAVVGDTVAPGAANGRDALCAADDEGPDRGGVVYATSRFVQPAARGVLRHDLALFPWCRGRHPRPAWPFPRSPARPQTDGRRHGAG